MGTVKDYLEDERDELLSSYGLSRAEAFAADNTLPHFTREMYEKWAEYYRTLIALTNTMTTFTQDQFRSAVDDEQPGPPTGENQVLQSLITYLSSEIKNDDNPRSLRRQLRVLRHLLRIEFKTNKRLINEVFK